VLPDHFADTLAVLLDDLEPLAIEDDESGRSWRIHFADEPARRHAEAALSQRLGAWCEVRQVDVPDEGWAHKVQETLRAVRVGRITVAPPWDVPPATGAAGSTAEDRTGAEIVIVIEPSMGFGTGHHQSTRLCLAALQRLRLEGARVIDVGTGSGVLALAARRLGAGEVLAIDNDPDSVAAAHRNVALNDLTGHVRVGLADLATGGFGPADLVVANLTAWLFRQHAGAVASLVRPGGRCVTSGYTRDPAALVKDALSPQAVETTLVEEDWQAIVFRRG
jgi:ribosomal protein L11 methyltransferase